MSTSEFDIMDSLEKIELLGAKGLILGIRNEGCFQISLFQLGLFYVEIYFHVAQSSVRLIRCFNKTPELNAYPNEMEISELIEDAQFKR